MASPMKSTRAALCWILWAAIFSLLPRPTPAQAAHAEINGVRLYHEGRGSGPALVLIHGWAVNSDYWDDQMPAFREKYRVIRYDRRGFGKSGGVPDWSADPADLDQLLAKLGIESAYILGHSQGAVVAQAFALSYPRRVKALIVFGSGPVPGFGLPWSGPDALPFPEIVRAARTHGVDSIWKFMEKNPLFTQDALSPEQVARLERIKKSYRGGDLLSEIPPSRPKEIATIQRLLEITAPTLVLTGDREAPYLRVMADAIAYAIPNSTRIVLGGGGHLINLSRPAEFNTAVLNYLTSLDRPKNP
jgi:3-oxoadipate enol-lactonase